MDISTFPECLLVAPSPSHINNAWLRNHNRAVVDFKVGRYGINGLTRNERAILALADGIATWCRLMNGDGDDYYANDHVVSPLVDAFNDALNSDLGRLDGATLSRFAVSVGRAHAGRDD